MSKQESLFFSQKELAEILGVSLTTITNYINEGIIPKPIKVGRLNKWEKEAIHRWVDEGCPKDYEDKRDISQG